MKTGNKDACLITINHIEREDHIWNQLPAKFRHRLRVVPLQHMGAGERDETLLRTEFPNLEVIEPHITKS